MDRQLVYPYEGVQDVDILLTNKNAMVGLGYALQAILGGSTVADGLACTPTSPAGMTVNVATGSIYSLAQIDATAYGTVNSDTTDQIVKQGIAFGTTNFACAAPSTTGQSVVYLVQAQYQDQDSGSTNEPFVNSSNNTQYFSTVNTVRKGVCVLSLKAGTAATTGTQATPTPDAGYVGLWAITVANGATTITSGNIAQYPGAPFIGTKLTQRMQLSQIGRGGLLTLSTSQSLANASETVITWPTAIYDTDGCTSSAGFTVPAGVSLVRMNGQATFANSSTGARKMRVLKNGTFEGYGLFSSRVGTPDSADVTILNGSGAIVQVSPGDTLALMALQSSGGALNLVANDTWFSMEIIK